MKKIRKAVFWLGSCLLFLMRATGAVVSIYGYFVVFQQHGDPLIREKANLLAGRCYLWFWWGFFAFLFALLVLHFLSKSTIKEYIIYSAGAYLFQIIGDGIFSIVLFDRIWSTGFMESFSLMPFKFAQICIIVCGYIGLLLRDKISRKNKEM